jgi:hypothetical protein
MRFAVEAWAPEYGAAVDDAGLVASDEPVDVTVEVAAAAWAPQRPAAGTVPPATILFVDGVQRIDARVWVTTDGGDVHQGVCASYAAGVVRCDGAAKVVAAEVRRALFCPADSVEALVTKHGRFAPVATSTDQMEHLSLAVHQKMGDLEVEVARATAAAGELVVVDGPLRQHKLLPGALGYIKSQARSYGPPVVAATVARLDAGERTPVFVVGERWQRYSWYLRLPGERAHDWAAIVRCEATTDLPRDHVIVLADEVCAALPRFASVPHKDPRAPQNLFPIAGLERELRRRLGDRALLFRSLRAASASRATA